jgi:hypothetical protein
MDDVGASSKRYEIYSDYRFGVGSIGISANLLFLKYLKPFKKWGVYRELKSSDWQQIIDKLDYEEIKLTLAITAAWADNEFTIIPFQEKYPDEAELIKDGQKRGLLEIANHGLTHCVVENNLFKPKWFSSNRKYHREFWDWVSPEIQEKHIKESQSILKNYFKKDIVTFVPPGNVFTDITVKLAERYGIKYISCRTAPTIKGNITIIGNQNVIPFHDRDIIINGQQWFDSLINDNKKFKKIFICELGETLSHLLKTQTAQF